MKSPETKLYPHWAKRRYGHANPHDQTNLYWQSLVRSGISAYEARKRYGGGRDQVEEPWCFSRYGQSRTELPDGRTVLVAGEHEDSYDPDFCIFNDVVVFTPEDQIEIFGYPRNVFPPTDFHSATLVNNDLLLIGNLGYTEDRRPNKTQVYRLSLADYSVLPVETTGANPGWLHSHKATLDAAGRAILITGGKIDRGPEEPIIENIDDWRLDLDTLNWERLTERRWPRWSFSRTDEQMNKLWMVQHEIWRRQIRLPSDRDDLVRQHVDEELSGVDFAAYEHLYRPSIPHQALSDDLGSEESEYGVHRVQIDGVNVRYEESVYEVVLTVEGNLSSSVCETLWQELLAKLERVEGVPWLAVPLLQD